MDRLLLEQLAGEALRELLGAVRGTLFCRSTAERLRRSVEPLLPLVQGLGPRSAGELGELAAWVQSRCPCLGGWPPSRTPSPQPPLHARAEALRRAAATPVRPRAPACGC